MGETADPPLGMLAFYAGRGGLFDGVRPHLQPAAGLLVRNGRVVAVGTAAEVCPADARRMDLGDAVLVPGFVDAHTHITIRPGEGDQHGQLQGPPAWQAIRGVANLRQMIQGGVTTARIMTEEHDIDYEFRAAIERGEVDGPRLRVAGPGLSPPGGHGSATGGVAGVDALRAAVRERIDKGADHIKIFTTGGVSSAGTSLDASNYTAGEIEVVVTEAAEAGLHVGAHAHGGLGVDLAVRGGVRSIEHGALLTGSNIAAMVEAGTWLVLTNSILFHPTGIGQGDASEPAILAKVEHARRSVASVAGMVRQAGVPVAVGTDSMHGLIGYELRWMVDHGWSPLEAMQAVTRNGAELLGIDDEIGALEPGKRADAVALRGDPLSDIDAAADVAAVIKGGSVVAGHVRDLGS